MSARIYIIYIYIHIYIWSCALRSQPPPMMSPPTPPMLCFKSANSHRCFKSANSHRDEPLRGRHPRSCRRLWCLKASILVTVVTFGPSCCRRASEVPTVTGIGVVLIAILRTVVTLAPYCMFLSRFRCINRSTVIDISLL